MLKSTLTLFFCFVWWLADQFMMSFWCMMSLWYKYLSLTSTSKKYIFLLNFEYVFVQIYRKLWSKGHSGITQNLQEVTNALWDKSNICISDLYEVQPITFVSFIHVKEYNHINISLCSFKVQEFRYSIWTQYRGNSMQKWFFHFIRWYFVWRTSFSYWWWITTQMFLTIYDKIMIFFNSYKIFFSQK